jgi:o-succinylbenzoate synthase
MLKIDRVEVRAVTLPLANAFETSFARETHKDCLLIRCFSGGCEGWGEVSAMSAPL